MDTGAPPVPRLPDDMPRTSSVSHVADIFTTEHKPLPPIHFGSASDDSDNRSLVVVDPTSRTRDQTLSPDVRLNDKSKSEGRFISHAKRRSMSVSDIDLQKLNIHAPSSPAPSLPPKDEHPWESSSLHGILSDFKGVLSKLDPDPGSSLDLLDPSTPTRRVPSTRPRMRDSQSPESRYQGDSFKSPVLPPVPSTPIISLPTRPSLDFDTDVSYMTGKVEPIVPPRTSSLQTPRSRSGSAAIGSPRVTALRHGSSPLRSKGYGNQMQSSYRDMSRLRVQHNSAASSSEPSLLSPGDDGRPCQQKLLPLVLDDTNVSFFFLFSLALMLQLNMTISFLTAMRPIRCLFGRMIWMMKIAVRTWLQNATLRMKSFWQRKRLQSGWADSKHMCLFCHD